MSDQIEDTIATLQARADACMANGERQYASGIIEAIQALRRIAPVAVKAPEPSIEPADTAPVGESRNKILGVF